jgi:hypothetical protein
MEKDFYKLAHYFLSAMEGDTHLVEDAYKLLEKYGIVDEGGFEVHREDN